MTAFADWTVELLADATAHHSLVTIGNVDGDG